MNRINTLLKTFTQAITTRAVMTMIFITLVTACDIETDYDVGFDEGFEQGWEHCTVQHIHNSNIRSVPDGKSYDYNRGHQEGYSAAMGGCD